MQPESKHSPEIEYIAILKDTKSEFRSEDISAPRYYCNMCGKSFIKKSSLTDHVVEHMYDLPICHICGQVIPKQNYKSHIISHVRNKEQYICGTCNEYFSSKGSLKLHFLRKHTYKRKLGYKCHDCAKVFHNKTILEVHIKQGHFEMKTFICDLCRKTFESYVGLKAHIKMYDGNCAISLYQCNYCEKSYDDKVKLSIHIRIHTGEKPYTCDQCGQSFRLKAALSLHLRSHNKLRPFECEVCKKNFRLKYHLKIHLTTHERKCYSCPHCVRKYRHNCTLIEHIRKYHTPVNYASCGESVENVAKPKARVKIHRKRTLRRKETLSEQVTSNRNADLMNQIKSCRVSLIRFDAV